MPHLILTHRTAPTAAACRSTSQVSTSSIHHPYNTSHQRLSPHFHLQDGTDSGRLSLDKPGVNLFERGQRDVFDVQSLELDPLYKIRIGHDNSGQAGSWHLAYVEITNRETGQRYHFPGDRWLSLTDGERQLECEVGVA